MYVIYIYVYVIYIYIYMYNIYICVCVLPLLSLNLPVFDIYQMKMNPRTAHRRSHQVASRHDSGDITSSVL